MTGHEKCRDCKWLSKEKSSIGRKCVAPNKVYKHYYSAFKQPCAKACKRFFEPAEKKPEETHEKHTPKARVRLIDAELLKQDLMYEYNNYRRRGAELTMYDISYTLGEILEEFVDKAPTVKAGEQTDAKSVRSKCEADHDREWIIGCILMGSIKWLHRMLRVLMP